MQDTVYNGKVQKMYTMNKGEKVAKRTKMVLEDRSISTGGKKANWMRWTLGQHPDFKNETSMIDQFLVQTGHVPAFLPNFHPELNPIEWVWAQLKRYTKAHCEYSLPPLRKNLPLAYDSVTVENIRNHLRKRKHTFCDLEGFTPGKDLDDALKK